MTGTAAPFAPEPTSAADAGASTGQQRWALVVAAVASFVVALDLLVVTTALDTIRRDLDASLASLQWTVTAYILSFAVLLMTGAALGDRFGRRRMFAAGLALFVTGSAGAALSGSVGTLILARIVQGAGAATIVPLGLTIVTSAYPAERRGAAIGLLEGITGLAVIAGPLLGGGIADRLSWEWIFWINVPIGALAIPLVLTRIDESHGPDRRLDGPGLALASGAAFGLVWSLVRANDAGWTSIEVLGTLVGGAACGAGFVAWERQAPAPMLPMRFFASRRFSAGVATAFLLSASLYSSVFFIAQLFQVGHGTDPLGAGLRLLPWTGTLLLVAPLAGALADRIGERPILAVGLTLQAIGMGWLSVVASTGQPYLHVLGPVVLAGLGCSAAVPVSQVAIVGAVENDEVGKAAGANNVFQELGGAFGVAVTVAVFAAAGGYGSAESFIDGFRPALAGTAVLAAGGATIALILPGRMVN